MLKVLPIISLIVFVIIHKICSTLNWYDWKIILGLVLSIAGDALLNYDELFTYGMRAFALVQICYIAAFGLKPLKPLFSLIFYALGIASECHLTLHNSINSIFFAVCVLVFHNLDIVLKIGFPVYVFLLTSMVWRSVVQAHTTPIFLNILCAFGSFIFAVSDSLIAIDKFYVGIPLARVSSF